MAEPTFRTVPILRIFDVAKAKEFYVGFLGLQVDWEHRFEPDAPVYMQVSRSDLVLHLSEHHGDCSPGDCVHVRTTGWTNSTARSRPRATASCAPASSPRPGARS
jgi:catechol 2,3-dioxygenase-like lactoylglutathione lyase family enzyme